MDSDSQELNSSSCRIADSISAGKYTVFAGLANYRIGGLWEDDWTLSFKSNRTLGSAGIRSDFRHISLSVQASSFTSLASSISAHTADSSFYATALIERGNPELGTVRWESANDSDEVHLIEARWETEYLRKGFSAGARIAGNDFAASLEQISTAPQNIQREYFIKDSSRIWFWDSRFTHKFEMSQLELYYAGLYANANIFGNTYRDNSTKRFMYIPLEATLHYGDIRWDHQAFGLQARGLKANIRMEKKEREAEKAVLQAAKGSSVKETAKTEKDVTQEARSAESAGRESQGGERKPETGKHKESQKRERKSVLARLNDKKQKLQEQPKKDTPMKNREAAI